MMIITRATAPVVRQNLLNSNFELIFKTMSLQTEQVKTKYIHKNKAKVFKYFDVITLSREVLFIKDTR